MISDQYPMSGIYLDQTLTLILDLIVLRSNLLIPRQNLLGNLSYYYLLKKKQSAFIFQECIYLQ